MILDLALDNRTVLTSELDCAIQELDMLFNTVNTELIGKPEYGTNFEQFLWTLTPMTEALKEYIENKLRRMYFVPQFSPTVEISTQDGELRDIYYVTISLKVNTEDPEVLKKSKRVYMLQ